MSTINLRYLATLLCFLVLFCAIQLTSAQVTFSKGWGPGKRAVLPNEPEYRVNAKSLALLFHSLLGELKRAMACDNHQAAVNYLQAAQIGEH